MKKMFVFFAMVTLAATTLGAAEKLTYSDLVSRLTDMQRLAELPPEGEITGQFTSYDRASKYDEATGKYIAWDANGDNNGCIETYEDGSILMAEIQGPGMINHIWSAAPGRGHVKIYLDGSDTPAVDIPFEDYFSGKVAPFDKEMLVYKTEANGCNNWVPISFQKSCRIIGERNWGAYYYFQYVRFPAGTEVPTFAMELDEVSVRQLAVAEAVFKTNVRATSMPEIEPQIPGFNKPFTLKPGETKEHTISGPCAIACIMIKPDLPEDDAASRDVLRGLTLSIYWDGEEKPAVWTPLGDFFGITCGRETCFGFPTGRTAGGMLYSNWYMPLKQAKVILKNENAEAVTFKGMNIITEQLKKDISAYGRFHAKWHRNAFLPEDPDRKIDWTILKTKGRGRYVGVSLHISNPRGDWWGEGDEKFFLDGEKFPSYFGTGSEDYFGYAWSSDKRFVRPFHSQPTNDHNKFFIVNNRWHITDAVNFQESFDGYIEKYFGDERPCDYSAIAFWYLDSEGTDPYEPVPLSQRVGYYNVEIVTHKLPEGGVSDGDLMPESGAPNLGFQGMGGFSGEWETDRQIFWQPREEGAAVTLRLPAAKAGKYKLSVRLTHSYDYAVIQFSVNDANVGQPVDAYHEGAVAAPLLELGEVELREGDNDLTLKAVGKNAKSKGYFAGVDYVVITPAE